MNFINNSIINFSLHECYIDSIYVEKSELILLFSNGIYQNGHKLSDRTELRLKISEIQDNEYAYVSICKFIKNKRIYVNYNEFAEMIKKDRFYIEIELYSDLAKGLLLKGYSKKTEMEVFITDIENLMVECK